MDGFIIYNGLVLPKNSTCDIKEADIIFLCGTVMYSLSLPIFFFVFWVGHHKKQKKHSSYSHLDIITFNLSIIEVMGVVGSFFISWGNNANIVIMKPVGVCLLSMSMIGQVFFHSLTCADRYLAVVHPISYLHLKNSCRDTIPRVVIALTWLCSALYGLLLGIPRLIDIAMIVGQILSYYAITITTFFAVSVLCVLTRPEPGKGPKRRISKSKRTAFNTVLVLHIALMVKFVFLNLYYLVCVSDVWMADRCVFINTVYCLEWPSALMMPLLFLHREGKLTRMFKRNMALTNVVG